jgi:predicted AlkP superfamily phosphohydrolase/phosphomutase
VIAYIGPGPGLAIQAPLLVLVLAVIAAALSLLSFPLRYLRRRGWKRRPAKAKRVVVLGLDGLEPTRVERLIGEGRLPHLRALSDQGCYRRLGTTLPPLSPVAWSSFSTGVNPGKHGIFGFVERDKDYNLRLTSASVESVQARLGPIPLPWTTERPVFRRKSTSFWKILADAGVLTHVLRVPITWPPERFSGFLLSAMGAPDLLGTQGTYTLFSATDRELQHGQHSALVSKGSVWQGTVNGPKDSSLPLQLDESEIRVGGQRIPLKVGEHTDWITLKFGSTHGLAQFFRVDQSSLYMTPIQIHPSRPAAPISWPPLFSLTLAQLCGPYATCGLAEDTGAREDGVLDDQAFLDHAYGIHEEREKQFFHLLNRTPEGCLLAVFDGPDRIQHMFSGDSQADVLDAMYERMDSLVGETHRQMTDPDDVLMVLSDHGFKPLRTLVDVNAWLHQAGLLQPLEGDVDWPKSQAAVYNLSGIRVNQAGRETMGIVPPAGSEALLLQIRQGLLELRHQGEQVFQDVFVAASIYQGPYVERAPDLVLGFAPGFGIFKDSSRGKVSRHVFHANTSAWSGDHCFHPQSVPGILFCNRPLRESPHITDLSATILDLHGVAAPPWMEGRSLLPDAASLPSGVGVQPV